MNRNWRSGVTVSLVAEARGGPFVYWDSLTSACRSAQELGFDTIEIFAPGADAVDAPELAALLNDTELDVAAFGTGAGWLRHQWTLTHESAPVRQQAIDFVRRLIDLAGQFSAPVIIGSMQGRWGGQVSHQQAWDWLAEGLQQLQQEARGYGVPVLYEPLNRYETNLCHTLEQGCRWLDHYQLDNVRLLADLFHMNIEEVDLGQALCLAGRRVGHIHFADSNRQAAGRGHLDFTPVVSALDAIGYDGILSAEVVPIPDSVAAARQTITTFRRLKGAVAQ